MSDRRSTTRGVRRSRAPLTARLGASIVAALVLALGALASPVRAQDGDGAGILEILKVKQAEKAAEAKEAEGAKEAETEKAETEEADEADAADEAGDAKAADAAEKAAAEKAAAEKAAAAEREAAAAAREAVKAVRVGAAGAAEAVVIDVATEVADTHEHAERAHDHGEETVVATETVDGNESGAPAANKEPLPPMFWMRDGTRLAGYPKIKQLHVETAYGPLVIPVSEVTRVRFAASQGGDFIEQLEGLILQLGDEEFDLREQAMEDIRKIGSKSVPTMRQALGETDDEEIKNRLEKLIGELEEEEEDVEDDELHRVPLKGDEDEIVTFQFTVMGRVVEKSFDVRTKYGELAFHRDDIISIVFREPLISKDEFSVPGDRVAGQNQWFDTGIDLVKGKSFELAASGSMTLQGYNVACGPEGTSNVPSRYEGHPAGALVGRIGAEGKAFLVGSSYSGEASEGGRLFLAIAMQSNQGAGSYSVELERPNE